MSEVLNQAPPEGSIEHAVSRLLKEPTPEPTEPPEEEQLEEVQEEAPQEVEPEETEEVVEEESEEAEAETEETETTEYEVEEEAELEPEETEEVQYFAVKIDGEELEVTMDELLSGYQRQSDYTKKTQALSDERRAVDANQSEMKQLHDTYMHQATLANELLNRDLKKYEAINWDTLKTEDPVGYVQKQLEVQEVRQQQQALQEQVANVQQVQQAQFEKQRAEVLQQEGQEMLRLFPEWKSPEKAQQAQGAIVEYARSAGYTEEELGSITRAKDLFVLDQARKFAELSKTKKGIVKKQKPAVRKVVKTKGIAPKKTAKKKQAHEAKSRLKKSGSLKDAAAYMHQMRSSNHEIKR